MLNNYASLPCLIGTKINFVKKKIKKNRSVGDMTAEIEFN